jgi:hypothetical protein
MELAKTIWQKHVDVFDSFDLVCHNGHSLQYETMSNGLFNALEAMIIVDNGTNKKKIEEAKIYLKGSKYYSDENEQSDY